MARARRRIRGVWASPADARWRERGPRRLEQPLHRGSRPERRGPHGGGGAAQGRHGFSRWRTGTRGWANLTQKPGRLGWAKAQFLRYWSNRAPYEGKLRNHQAHAQIEKQFFFSFLCFANCNLLQPCTSPLGGTKESLWAYSIITGQINSSWRN